MKERDLLELIIQALTKLYIVIRSNKDVISVSNYALDTLTPEDTETGTLEPETPASEERVDPRFDEPKRRLTISGRGLGSDLSPTDSLLGTPDTDAKLFPLPPSGRTKNPPILSDEGFPEGLILSPGTSDCDCRIFALTMLVSSAFNEPKISGN